MFSVTPYKINIADSQIDRLKQKLALADFPNDATDSEGASWDQGPPVSEIRRLALVWQNEYSWRKAEAELNKFPQFIAPIEVDSLKQTYNIHFLHEQSLRGDAIPLLFLHGWPGSFIEVTKMVSDLVEGDDDDGPVFHVVAPSLVDFGFSSCSTVGEPLILECVATVTDQCFSSPQKGFRFKHHAEVCHKLMKALGYERYGTYWLSSDVLVDRF